MPRAERPEGQESLSSILDPRLDRQGKREHPLLCQVSSTSRQCSNKGCRAREQQASHSYEHIPPNEGESAEKCAPMASARSPKHIYRSVMRLTINGRLLQLLKCALAGLEVRGGEPCAGDAGSRLAKHNLLLPANSAAAHSAVHSACAAGLLLRAPAGQQVSRKTAEMRHC